MVMAALLAGGVGLHFSLFMDPDPDPGTCELRELALPRDQRAVPDFGLL